MTAMCPHCGFDLIKSEPIITDGFTLFPDGRVKHEGEVLKLTLQEGQVLYTVAKAGGEPVMTKVIGERISHCAGPWALVKSIMTRLRRKFEAWGIDLPLYVCRGIGIRWRGDGVILTPKQQQIFDYLKAHRGQYFSSKAIERALDLPPQVRNHIFNMRKRGVSITSSGKGWMVE